MRVGAISIVLSVILCGCATGSGSTHNQQSEDDIEDYITEIYCFPSDAQPSVVNGRGLDLLPPATPEEADALAFLSPSSRQIAEVIQVQHIILQIPILEKEVSRGVGDARIRLIELRQALSDQVLAALFDAISVAAELECEGRADALASGMERNRTTFNNDAP
jgi:hypothetical protein